MKPCEIYNGTGALENIKGHKKNYNIIGFKKVKPGYIILTVPCAAFAYVVNNGNTTIGEKRIVVKLKETS